MRFASLGLPRRRFGNIVNEQAHHRILTIGHCLFVRPDELRVRWDNITGER
jgi:hypothetical protein